MYSGNSNKQDRELLARLWQLGHTPIRIERLQELLKNYPNREAAEELYLGFSLGFRLQYTGPREHVMSKNLVSAEHFKWETLNKLKTEIELGRILGPFSKLPISNLRISPIGLVPKSDGGWRLITHLSHPDNNSVNSYIEPALCKVSYSTLDSILDKIYALGSNVSLAKMDVKSAFRLLIVNPADFDLMGIKFNGYYFVDKALAMGCSLSCKLFNTFANFLQWVVERQSGLNSIDHYLDDFIFMGAENTNDCLVLMDTFTNVCNELGVPIAENKTMGPTTVLPFLGFLIDTKLMMILIPPEKLEKLKVILEPLLFKKKNDT